MGKTDDLCAVCLTVLCEPVPWTDCSHHFCLFCTAQLRLREPPKCPLCRAPGARVRRISDLYVDHVLARDIRKRWGPARYDDKRIRMREDVVRLLQSSMAKPIEMFLLCHGPWDFQLGSEHGLQLKGPRECDLAMQALSATEQRFGVVLGARIEAGARGRIAEIVGHTVLEDGVIVVVVRGREAFVVREVVRSGLNRHGRGLGPPRGFVSIEDSDASSGSAAPLLLRRSRSTPVVSSNAANSVPRLAPAQQHPASPLPHRGTKGDTGLVGSVGRAAQVIRRQPRARWPGAQTRSSSSLGQSRSRPTLLGGSYNY